MKVLVASDLHGSLFYTKKLFEQVENEKIDQIILLGDILYHGPRNDLPKDYNPKELVDLLNSYADKIVAVRGNCDSEVDQMVLNFDLSKDYQIITIDNQRYLITHGHLFDSKYLQKLEKGIRVISGHTHIPVNYNKDDITYLNPGSISIPKNNSQNSYLIIDDNKIIFKNIDGENYNL
jgi:putative phosphoesterase